MSQSPSRRVCILPVRETGWLASTRRRGMRSLMVRLSGLLTRRRWWVVAAWLAIVIVAAPMAAKQTEHLSGGGFDVPGSQSQVVETATAQRFASTETGRIAVV